MQPPQRRSRCVVSPCFGVAVSVAYCTVNLPEVSCTLLVYRIEYDQAKVLSKGAWQCGFWVSCPLTSALSRALYSFFWFRLMPNF